MARHDRIFAGLLAIIAILGALALVGVANLASKDLQRTIERKQECEAKGGVYFRGRQKSLCVKNEAILD